MRAGANVSTAIPRVLPPSQVTAFCSPDMIGAASQKIETNKIAMITAKIARPQTL